MFVLCNNMFLYCGNKKRHARVDRGGKVCGGGSPRTHSGIAPPLQHFTTLTPPSFLIFPNPHIPQSSYPSIAFLAGRRGARVVGVRSCRADGDEIHPFAPAHRHPGPAEVPSHGSARDQLTRHGCRPSPSNTTRLGARGERWGMDECLPVVE